MSRDPAIISRLFLGTSPLAVLAVIHPHQPRNTNFTYSERILAFQWCRYSPQRAASAHSGGTGVGTQAEVHCTAYMR